MRILPLAILLVMSVTVHDAMSQSYEPEGKRKKSGSRKYSYEEINFEDMIRRYYEKEVGPFNSLEGIYTVSCVITKTSKSFLSGSMKERPVVKKDNYARVAIIKDRPQSRRDFIEVSLSYHETDKYPVMGEFIVLSEGRGMIYKHIEPDGSELSFSMKDETDLIEGEYSVVQGRKTIRYKLSYLKVYPKKSAEVTVTGFQN